jgi:YD repeat-containing protein
VGNRTTNGSVVNTGNQLTTDATFGYQYDDDGNLIRKTLLATGNYTQYTYDAENRLPKVEEFAAGNPTAITTSSYRYDGLGRRIEKVANGQTKRYVYDGEDILLEYDGSNALLARYTHGPGIDEPIAVTKAGSTFYYHQDGLGPVTELTDSNGSVAKAYAYDAYGNILDSPGTDGSPHHPTVTWAIVSSRCSRRSHSASSLFVVFTMCIHLCIVGVCARRTPWSGQYRERQRDAARQSTCVPVRNRKG